MRPTVNLFDDTMSLLVRVLDLREARQKVITANVANEETPGYRARDLVFVDELAKAVRGQASPTLRASDPRHVGSTGDRIAQVRGRIVELPAGELPLDANSVNLEMEMAKLTDNSGKYSGVAEILALRVRQMLTAIRDTQ